MDLGPVLVFELSPNGQVAALGALAILLMAVGVFSFGRLRKHRPAERERRRRLAVNARGRVGGAMITDYHERTLFYTYSAQGITYEASQDVSGLDDLLPGNLDELHASGSVKYLPENPANSIILCEAWSGLRVRPAVAAPSATQGLTKELNTKGASIGQ
jgi:hypothetical protein